MMEKKMSIGITVLGVITVILNFIFLSPFMMLLGIPVEPFKDKLLKVPLAAIPLVLSLLGIFCGVNLLRRVKLRLTLIIVKITIIYYILYAIFMIIGKFPADIYVLILFPVILNVAMLYALTRPKVKEQFR